MDIGDDWRAALQPCVQNPPVALGVLAPIHFGIGLAKMAAI